MFDCLSIYYFDSTKIFKIHLFCLPLRYRVVSMSSPRMTITNSFESKPNTFYGSPFFYGLYHIVRAGRLISTSWSKKWRYEPLINFDRKDKYTFDNIHGTNLRFFFKSIRYKVFTKCHKFNER